MPDRQQLDPGAYARVFSTGDGAAVLEDLVARFYDVNVWHPDQRETDRRAARREVLQLILARIGQVNDAPDDSNPAA